VGTGSREENASKQKKTIAFSSEVDTGSRWENASKRKSGAFGLNELFGAFTAP
jgi:hypothetical protein